MNKSNIDKIKQIIDKAKNILIIQADNPDGDSLASSLALEQILHKLGKEPTMYCSVSVQSYLKYLDGWDRVSTIIPKNIDASIIVDTSTISLLEKLQNSGSAGWVSSKPCIVLDHHGETKSDISFATVEITDPTSSSTGELIYRLSRELDWPIDKISGVNIMSAILSDTQGLTNDLTSPQTYRLLAELVDLGVNRPTLEDKRREMSKMEPSIFKYKSRLIERTELLLDNQLAYVVVPHNEIMEFSPLYNPAPLIQADMLQTSGVGIALVVKQYDDGHITGSIRCNQGFAIAAKVAEELGGGGHEYAAGFKIHGSKPINDLKTEIINIISKNLDELK
ncbi:MAG TPA: DHH family phosphoesterase [Candidatus Saccharibacteria bacterium]|nr:DHH family phosphoesterase [Candidatus Saccharibacteria bacterium]